MPDQRPNAAELRLLWIPLGAGQRVPVVRVSGWLYERITAVRERRRPAPLYHCALLVSVGDAPPTAIEMAPVWQQPSGVTHSAVRGPVGTRWLGRWRLFQYEVRCVPGGRIPDASSAIGGPVTIASDQRRAEQLIAAVARLPTPTWGRDELDAGEMWNSNSVIAWLLARSGHAGAADLHPADGGRAPGWSAGIAVAGRTIPP